MNLDIGKAFIYPFQDRDWLKKCLIGSLFTLGCLFWQVAGYLANLPSEEDIDTFAQSYPTMSLFLIAAFFIISIIAFISWFIIDGYHAKNTNLRIFKPNAPLLEWKNWGNILFTGYKSLGVLFLYSIVLFTIIPGIGYCIFIVMLHEYTISNIVFIIFMVFVSMVLCITFYGGTLAFKTDLRLYTYFNFILIYKIIMKNFLNFFLYCLIILALGIFLTFISVILLLTIVGIVFIPFVNFYMYLVYAELTAQFLRNTLELNTLVEQGE